MKAEKAEKTLMSTQVSCWDRSGSFSSGPNLYPSFLPIFELQLDYWRHLQIICHFCGLAK